MSAKWQRSKAWDDRFFPAWAWPAKALLRALSSITLAVVLLVGVALYAVLASVPIGLMALGVTKLLYAAIMVGLFAVVAGVPTWLVARGMRRASRPARFATAFFTFLALGAVSLLLWTHHLWPALRWDAALRSGLRLFPDFVDAHYATTVRRLPALEMSEIEFYSWWPLRLVLLLFVLNMIVATVRRIEFRFVNAGVLAVHTGIVLLALGSMHYGALKQEGDVLLLAPAPSSTEPGPLENSFFDHQVTALWTRSSDLPWEQRPLIGLPRYNDYGVPWSDRTLGLAPPRPELSFLGEDVSLRVVGYGSYVDLLKRWEVRETPPAGARPNPVIDLQLVSMLPPPGSAPDTVGPPKAVAEMRLVAGDPAARIASIEDAMAVEHVPASQTARWEALTALFPAHAEHALVVRAVDTGGVERSGVLLVEKQQTVEFAGHRVRVLDLLPEPPFPIITPGFEGARSSVAVLEITPPGGAPFTRYVYHRFPEVDQDIVGVKADGRPERRAPDPALRIHYVDASRLQVYLRSDGAVAIRRPGGEMTILQRPPDGEVFTIAPKVGLRAVRSWPDAERVELPENVPDESRSRDLLGNHGAAAIAVEVGLPDGWRRTLWLPFSKYMNVDMGMARRVDLPDGRTLELAFSRLKRRLPGFSIALVDFEMIPYPGGDAPRDYVSLVRVIDEVRGAAYEHETRLNAPLIHSVPFRANPDAPAPANMIGRLVSSVAPNQFKLSQAGWDSQGWMESKAAWKRGETERPRAAFTILQVGNNPGIYVIATGGVLMSVGIPWAFYVKPWILKRRKRKIQRELAGSAPNGPRAPETV